MRNTSIFWALAISMAIFSCADLSEKKDQSDSGKDEQRRVRIFCWGDYVCPEVLEGFTKETGISVELEEFENSDDMIAALHSNPDRYDVITVDDSTFRTLQELSLLRKLDHTKLGNLANSDDRFKKPAFDPGNQYSVPYLAGTTLVAYRKDKISNIRPSWQVLFDPKFKGRIAMLDEFSDSMAVALMASGKPMNSDDPDDITEAKSKLVSQYKELGVRVGSFDEILEALQKGEIWVAMNYSGDAAALSEEDANIDFFIPEEGPILWMDNLVLSRDSQDFDAAHQFMNFMLKGESAAKNANYFYLISPNTKAGPLLDESILTDPRIYLSDDVLQKAEHILPFKSQQHAERYARAENEVARAIRENNSALSFGDDTLAELELEEGN